jgi:hypothetical protein
MRIVADRPDPLPGRHGLRAVYPELADVHVYTDDGSEIEGIVGCTIDMKPGEPIVAHLTVLVTELDVECEPRSPKD